MANPPALRWQTITDVLLKEIYDSDQAMYPAPQLTYDRLKSWVDAFPALSLCLQRGRAEASTHQESAENDAIHGLIIVLPLQQPYWDKLRRADIEEHDVDAMKMFPPLSASATRPHAQGSKTKVGLHVFHIERFPRFAATWKGARFTELALDEIRGRTTEAFESWEILGYSGESTDDAHCFNQSGCSCYE